MMKRFAVLLISILCFGEINWEITIIDTADRNQSSDYDFFSPAIAVDANGNPNILYSRNKTLFLVYKEGLTWSYQLLDSGYIFGNKDFVISNTGVKHFVYYCKNENSGMTYLRYTHGNVGNWVFEDIDSISNYINPWLLIPNILSMDIYQDIYLGIAYLNWNPVDSIHYIKYAQYNGIGWDTSVVEYDSIYAGSSVTHPDVGLSLKYSSVGVPYIGFHQYFQEIDTIKVAHYDTITQHWISETVLCQPGAGTTPVSLFLDDADQPHLIHSVNGWFFYSHRSGQTWLHENIGISIGWSGDYDLQLDNSGNPQVAFEGSTLMPYPNYCYKDSIWHSYIPFEDTLYPWGGIRFVLDQTGNSHIAYGFYKFTTYNMIGVKYARGVQISVAESLKCGASSSGLKIELSPNPFRGRVIIKCLSDPRQNHDEGAPGEILCSIYDICGRRLNTLSNFYYDQPFTYWTQWDGRDNLGQKLPTGIYFLVLKQNNEKISRKFLLIK